MLLYIGITSIFAIFSRIIGMISSVVTIEIVNNI